MSVQFGVWAFDAIVPGEEYFERVSRLLAPYGPDGEVWYRGDRIRILYRPTHTTQESRIEKQPASTSSGDAITWDGRLDNRDELARELWDLDSANAPDVSIVAAAYQRWGTESFKKLVGDWALSVWSPGDQVLTLARDPLGTRQLYYMGREGLVTWSTVLDPIVLLAGHSWKLNEEYLAGCLSFFPATDSTPYEGIDSVPPGSLVRLRPRKRIVRRYWEFDSSKEIRYKTDSQYEEHFRTVFAQSVARRLRADAPILAELSGGMDSSSIVSMADRIIASRRIISPRLDTVSYYDDSEPNWKEHAFFTKVEEKRGRRGCHIRVHCEDAFKADLESGFFRAHPGSRRENHAQEDGDYASLRGYRVVLSGIGGDEVLGGVPTPLPEIRDLLWRADLRLLARQLKVWALEQRKPWFHLFLSALRGFLPLALAGVPANRRPAAWLDPRFVRRHRKALRGYENRLRLFGPRPSFQENVATLEELKRQLGIVAASSVPPVEKRYPYLDRDLLEFVYAIPREQLVRPGQRRSLMRRTLAGIVPDEILARKRKAAVTRGAVTAASVGWSRAREMSEDLATASLGIVRRDTFLSTLENARHGREVPIVTLIRTIAIEFWLRSVISHGLVEGVAQEFASEATPTKEELAQVCKNFSAGNYCEKERR